MNADLNKVLSNSLMSGTVYSFYSMAVLFYILILLTWWMDRSKKKIFEMEQKKAQTKDRKVKDGKEEKFVCSDCGARYPGRRTSARPAALPSRRRSSSARSAPPSC